VVKTTNLKK